MPPGVIFLGKLLKLKMLHVKLGWFKVLPVLQEWVKSRAIHSQELEESKNGNALRD